VLADELADDVATLASVNETLTATGSAAGGGAAGGGHRRRIPYIFIAPSDRLEIGRLARDVYKRRYAGIRGVVRDTNLAVLGRIVNAERGPIHGELLSYLFLAREFVEELIALGQRDAARWLQARHDAGLWQIGQLTLAEGPASAGGRPRTRRPRTPRTV
jgi:NTE family protein